MGEELGLNVGAAVLFGLFLKKLVDTLRLAAGAVRKELGAASGLATQVAAFVAGIVAVLLFSASDLGDGLELGGVVLGEADVWSKAILGLLAASVGSTVTDVIKGVDASQTAAVPRLTRDRAVAERSATTVRRTGP